MKTPINGARLSSSFGKTSIWDLQRCILVLILRLNSTPILASGDGIVVRARWCGGGGNCVKIKHNEFIKLFATRI